MTIERATRLTPERIAELRERADREAGLFVNPILVEKTPIHNEEWAGAILGFEYRASHRILWRDRYLLHLAALAEPDPPPPPQETARRLAFEAEHRRAVAAEEALHRKRLARWERAVEALRTLGVRAEIRHSYTSVHHYDWYRPGKEHVYLLDDLAVGRLERPKDHPLCWTPKRAKRLGQFPADRPHGDLPTCKACLTTLTRLTGIDILREDPP